jgi:hypothetical protein
MAVFTNELKLDVGPMLKALTQAADKAEEAGREIQDGFVKGIKAGSEEAKNLATAFDGVASGATKSVGELKKSIAALIASGKGSGDAFDALVAELKQADAEAKKLQKALKEVDGLTIDVEVNLNEQQAVAAAGGIGEKIKGALDSVGGGGAAGGLLAGFIGGGVAGGVQAAFGAVADSIGAVINAGRELTNAQGNLAAQTGLTGDALNKLNDEAEKAFLGGVGGSLAEATKLIGNVQQQLGNVLPTEELGTFAARAQALAGLYDKDVNEVLAKSTPFIKQFGLSGDEAFNLIALASKDARTSQDDVLDSLAEYSQLLVQAGFSAEDFVGALSVAGEEGLFNTDKIADAIKESQIRLKAGDISKTLKDLNAQLPATLSNTIGSLTKAAESGQISIKEYLQQSGATIEEAFKAGNISESLRSQLQVAIAGTPAEDIGTEVYGKIFGAPLPEEEIRARAAAAGQSAGNAVGQFLTFDAVIRRAQLAFEQVSKVITQAFDDVFAFFQDVLAPTIEPLIAEIGGYFEEMSSVVGPILTVIGGLIATYITNALTTAGAILRVLFGIAKEVFAGIARIFAPLGEAIAGVFGADSALNDGVDLFETFKGVLKDVGTAVQAFAGVVIELGGFLVDVLLTPIRLIVDAVILVVKWFGDLTKSTNETKKSTEQGASAFQKLLGIINALRDGLAGVRAVFDLVIKTLETFFTALVSFNIKAAIDAFTGFGDKAAKAFNDGYAKRGNEQALEQGLIDAQNKTYNEWKKIIAQQQAEATKLTEKGVDERKKAIELEIATLLKSNKITEEQAKLLAKQAADIKAGRAGAGGGGGGGRGGAGAGGATQDALKRARELFAVQEKSLASEREALETAVLRQQLDKDAERVALKKIELDTQKKLTAEFVKAFGAVVRLDDVTKTERIIQLGFKADETVIDELDTKFQSFAQAEIRLQAELSLKPEELEKNVQKSLKFFNESFKKNAKELTEGIIDPVQFQTAVQGLRGSFASLKQGLEDALKTPEVQASPALLKAYEEQILLVNLKLSELNNDAIEAENKARAEQVKTTVDLNKRRISILSEDEKRNAKEIESLLRANLALETDLKLRSLTSTGEVRAQETKIIIDEATKQAKEIEKKYKQSSGIFESLTGGVVQALTTLDFTGVFDTLTEEATAAADDTVAALKAGTLDYQSAVAELEGLATESGGILEGLLQKLSDSFQKIADSSIQSLSSISAGFKGSEEDIEKLLAATAQAAAAGFAAILVSGEEFGKGFVLLILDILDATIPALVALILGQSLAANPLAGAVISAALIATLKGAVALARAAANGFEEGGYTGNMGTKAIAGVVHGQEFVMHAKATKQFRPVLEQMNRGHMPMIDNGEFSAMRSELSAIRKRLDGMPNGIQGSQAVRLDVGFDNYIYERDRRRAALRGLRG